MRIPHTFVSLAAYPIHWPIAEETQSMAGVSRARQMKSSTGTDRLPTMKATPLLRDPTERRRRLNARTSAEFVAGAEA
jgi:hypothetical protein